MALTRKRSGRLPAKPYESLTEEELRAKIAATVSKAKQLDENPAADRVAGLEPLLEELKQLENELLVRPGIVRFQEGAPPPSSGLRVYNPASPNVARRLSQARGDQQREQQREQHRRDAEDANAELQRKADARWAEKAPEPVEWAGFHPSVLAVLASAVVVRWLRGITSPDETYLDSHGRPIVVGSRGVIRPLLDVNDLAALHTVLMLIAERDEGRDQATVRMGEHGLWPAGLNFRDKTLRNLERLGFITQQRNADGTATFGLGPLSVELYEQFAGLPPSKPTPNPRVVHTDEYVPVERVSWSELDPQTAAALARRGWQDPATGVAR